VFAFQFKNLSDETHAAEIAMRRSNMSVYSPDQALINGVAAPWRPGNPPTRDWHSVRDSYWSNGSEGNPGRFELGRYDCLARFFASSGSTQYTPEPPAEAVNEEPTPA